MPTYHALNITVRLGSMPLAETTTSEVVLKKGEVAKRQSEAAEKKLLHSFLLDEERVLFPGDPEGYELNWLGNAPFMQVQADAGFTRLSGSLQRSEINRPQALALHIKLSDKAFYSGFTGKTHLKIEVLFNGQLSACSLVHTNDIRSGAKSLHQIFAGYRVDFLAERPWVLLPPFTTADGGTRRFHKTITPSERWEELSAALLKEVKKRGTDKCGESPPSAEFLYALANMQMPQCVLNMQKPGGRKFGVVDVVITAGVGNKLTTGTNYLKSPQRLNDSNYIIRADIESRTGAAAAKSDMGYKAANKTSQEAVLDLDDAHTGVARDSDSQDERPRKRRALSPVEHLPPYAAQSTDFQSPFLGAQIPFLPPSSRSTSKNDLSPTAGKVIPRCSSPDHRGDGYKEPLPSNDCNRTCDAACELLKAQDWNSNVSRIFQRYHSPPPDLQPSIPHLLPVHSASIGMSPAVSMIDHAVFGGLPFATSASGSSPMPQILSKYSPHFAQLTLPGGSDTPITSAISPGPSTPRVVSTALMLPTSTGWLGSPNATASPYYHPTHLPQQTQPGLYPLGLASYMPLNRSPSLFPQTPPFFGHPGSAQFATPVVPSPPAFQMCGPLPPTAMFSVPLKSRRSASPTKDIAGNSPDESRPSVLVSRLVITALNGMPVVDHRWNVAQRIIVNHERLGEGIASCRAETPVSEHEKPDARCRAPKRNSQRNKSSQANSRAASPIKKLQPDTAEQSMHERQQDSLQDGQVDQATTVPLPYLKRHQGPTNENLSINARIDVPDKIAPFVSAPLLTTAAPTLTPTSVQTSTSASSTQPATSQRRAFSRNVLPGIQGPKAATFLLDDPEEVLREAARMRRSRSPTKPVAKPSVPSVTPPAHLESTSDQGDRGDSSPLSSVPSSPLPERPAEAVGTAPTPSGRIQQLDGSAERTIPAKSPRKLQAPSPKKPSFPTPKFRRPGLATPQSSVSPNSRKRKASHGSPTKPPRSPDRLKTVHNPPLNDDCVIAFAESIDKKEKKGVVRQVKGERQGMFKEECVVLAVRFFIAGD